MAIINFSKSWKFKKYYNYFFMRKDTSCTSGETANDGAGKLDSDGEGGERVETLQSYMYHEQIFQDEECVGKDCQRIEKAI